MAHSSPSLDSTAATAPQMPPACVSSSATHPKSATSLVRQDWLTPGRSGWKFKCPGPSGGGPPGAFVMDENTFVEKKTSSEENNFTCNDCSIGFTLKKNLDRHKKFTCHKSATIDHLEASKRRNQSQENLLSNVADLENTSITYSEDSEMQEFISSHPSDYAKFRLCEDKRHPQSCPGFWPLLLDYRGKSALSGVETSIGVKNAYKTLGEISSDLYRFVQCDIKKCAFDSLKLEQNPQNCD